MDLSTFLSTITVYTTRYTLLYNEIHTQTVVKRVDEKILFHFPLSLSDDKI